MVRVVLDTNVLLVSISPNAPNHWIIRHFLNEDFILCVTTDILLEYEEVITRHMGALTATNFMEALDNAPHVELITRYFKWGLIEADPDDNKFVDCATEPGTLATFSAQALQLGGVARVQLTQCFNCWQLGFHKSNPALVQCAPPPVHRDRHRDFKRTGDALMPARGINHHGTRPGYVAKVVGMFSLGCSVRLHWKDHLEFIELLRTDPRYVADPGFRFSATYLDGGKVWATPVVE